MNRVCAGVVTFNRARLLERCVRHLMNQSVALDQIFVVDNASTDSTREVLGKLFQEFPGKITAIHHSTNEGSAGGFSDAARAAYEWNAASKQRADWIWLVDDDVVVEKDALEQLLQSRS